MKKLICNIVRTFRSSVSKWFNVATKVYELAKGYVGEQLKDASRLWDKYRAVILNLPTGAGKTTFVVNVIIPMAIKFKKRVLIVSNRIALDMDIKKRIAKLLEIYQNYPDDILRNIDDFGLITVTTYQKLAKYLNDKEFCKNISWFIADEVHFFTSDSLFNCSTYNLLYSIPKEFKQAIRIYISATIDDVFPYICDAECNDIAITMWQNRFLFDKSQQKLQRNCNDWEYRKVYPDVYEKYISDKMDACFYPLPIIYTRKRDTNYMNLDFYSDPDTVIEKINASNDKSIVFVESKKRGKELKDLLPDSSYMTSEINNDDPSLLHEIISQESFKTKTLITTSVFSNGCNINDASVKDVFIENTSPVDIIQMAGRRRKVSDKDRVNIHIRIPDLDMLKYYISNNNQKLTLIKQAKKDTDKFLNEIINETPDSKRLKGLYYILNGKPVFNQIAIDMLQKNNHYYAEVKEMIELHGESAYCKKTAKLFNKRFKQDMIVKPHDYKQDTITWLNSLTEKESIDLKSFGSELIGQIAKFNHETRERSDRILHMKALNNRLTSNGLPFEIICQEGRHIIEKK
ncbi:MAG: DEAD/DEAH box helicase family protein [Clostridia bacterium]|nr:DEAD/DEAH box helicase family protein [Clostridia bacterium]